MKHAMKLQPSPFERIKSGKKTIELRLYDEKRRKIQAGDEIEFTNAETGEIIATKVIDLFVFDTFSDLYKSLPLDSCGYSESEIATASPEDMSVYYSEEEQKKYGVVGIKIALL